MAIHLQLGLIYMSDKCVVEVLVVVALVVVVVVVGDGGCTKCRIVRPKGCCGT